MFKPAIIGFALFFLLGCSSIERYKTLTQARGKSLTAGPGDVIAKVVKERDLENVFGKADVFGRRTVEGYAELRFIGLKDKALVFERRDLEIQTNETTMSRSGGAYIPQSQTTTTTGTVGTTPVHGTSTTRGGGVAIASPQTQAVAILSQPVQIKVPAKDPEPITFEGWTVNILSVTPGSIQYVIN